ncbi:glycosyltransferase family 2 protein [Planctomycetota bacterium]
MNPLDVLLLAFCVLASLEVSVLFFQTSLKLARLGVLEAQPELDSDLPLPSLSVVIAARDQASTLRDTVGSLLRQGYPDLEIVIVDDRSEDGTGALVDALAQESSQVKPVHIEVLPEGWLGKVNALRVGTERGTGELTLYTDADVVFAPDVVATAIGSLHRLGLDHLTIMPRIHHASFFHGVFVAALSVLGIWLWVPETFGEKGSGRSTGFGSFNLVRKAALDQTAGFAWLKMEVLDDRGLGLLLQQAGFRGAALLSTGELSVAWYGSVWEMVQGLEKNLFGGVTGYSFALAMLHLANVAALALGPAVALTSPYVWPLGALAIAGHVGFSLLAARRLDRSPLSFLLFPVGMVFVGLALVNSTLSFARHRGIVWRGTRYAADALRQGQRVR